MEGSEDHDRRVVTSEVRDGVGVVSLNRPAYLNALTYDVVAQARNEMRAMGERSDVRAVVLRGEGRAFCAGLDLDAGLGAPEVDDPVEAMNAGMRVGLDLVWVMRSIPQPVIAVVQGYAVGAGFAFAAAADVRFIGAEAKFSAPFLAIGMTVGDLGLSWFLPRIIGQGRAAELFFSAGTIEAQDAVTAGLASQICDDPLADALAYARQIAAFPVYGVQESKRLLNASGSASLRDHLDSEARAQVIGSMTRHAQHAMTDLLASTKK